MSSSYQTFAFVVGETPLADLRWALAASAAYVVFIYAFQAAMAKRAAFKLKWLSFLHDVILSLGSLIVLVMIGYELTQAGSKYGVEALLCDSRHFGVAKKGPLIFWYYLFYLSKYYEFVDTVLIVAKKKPVIFLHIYHHFVTLLVAWSSLSGEIPMQWIPIGSNLAVHVIMYYYYALASVGIRSGWKKYLTSMQIVQFVVDLIAIAAVIVWHATHGWFCHGQQYGYWFPFTVIFTFLILFIKFYRTTYAGEKKEL